MNSLDLNVVCYMDSNAYDIPLAAPLDHDCYSYLLYCACALSYSFPVDVGVSTEIWTEIWLPNRSAKVPIELLLPR